MNRKRKNEKKQLGNHASGALRSSFAAQIGSQIVSIVVLSILYGRVSQQAFGFIGMMFPLLMLPRTFLLSGLGAAAVQSKTLEHDQQSTLAWLHALLGIAATAFTALLVPLAAWWYAVPELKTVGWTLCGTSLLAALVAHWQVMLERDLKLVGLAWARFAALAIAGSVAVGLAILGWDVQALIVQQYIELGILFGILFALKPWRPSGVKNLTSMIKLAKFGSYYSLSGLLFFAAQNVDKIMISVLFGATASGQALIGMYTQAFQWMMRPVYLVGNAMSGVMLPILSRAKDGATFQNLTLDFYRLVALLLCPAGVGLMLVAPDLMLALGGEDWRPAGAILAVLAPAIVVQGMFNISGSILAAAGKADRLFYGSVATVVVLAQAYGFVGWINSQYPVSETTSIWRIGLTYSATMIGAIFVPYMLFVGVCVKIHGRSLIGTFVPSLLRSLSMGIVCWIVLGLLREWTPWMRLLGTVVAGAAFYAAMSRSDVKWLVDRWLKK